MSKVKVALVALQRSMRQRRQAHVLVAGGVKKLEILVQQPWFLSKETVTSLSLVRLREMECVGL